MVSNPQPFGQESSDLLKIEWSPPEKCTKRLSVAAKYAYFFFKQLLYKQGSTPQDKVSAILVLDRGMLSNFSSDPIDSENHAAAIEK